MIRTLSVSAVIFAAIGSGVAVMAADAMPSVSIAAPAMGATFTGTTIPVTVAAKNFTIECTNVGQGMKAGRGHYHVMIDGMSMAQMTNLYCTNSFAVSGAGLRAGEHTLAVVLASDDHVMVGKPAMTKFMYAPKVAQPLPEAAAEKPVVTIVSPKTGTIVGRNVELKVAISGYDLSCNLEGKPNVAGYGHLHVFVMQDAMPMHDMGEMKGAKSEMKSDMKDEHANKDMKKSDGMGMESMAMPGMIGMPCTKTVPVDLSAWKAGKTTLMVMLAKNDHMPTAGAVPASVDVVVK